MLIIYSCRSYIIALWIENTSGSDEATKAAAKKAQTEANLLFHDTSAMLYQLSYEALLEAGQE